MQPHLVLRLAPGPGHAAKAPDWLAQLLLIRVDGERSAATVCEAAPADALRAFEALAALEKAGLVEPAPEEVEHDGPAFSYFKLDPANPPEDVPQMIPAPRTNTDADSVNESGDYFLYSQVDGGTSVEQLAFLWGRSVARTFQTLIELHHRGLVGFPASFNRSYLVQVGGDQPQSEVVSEEAEALMKELAADPIFAVEIMPMVPSVDSNADVSRLSVDRTQGYPLALVDGRHSVEEICNLSARGPADTLAFVLYLFHVGLVKLESGEIVEAAAPAPTPAPAPAPAPKAEAPAPSGEPVLEMEMTWEDAGDAGAPIAAAAALVTPPPPAEDDLEANDSYDSGTAEARPGDISQYDSSPSITGGVYILPPVVVRGDAPGGPGPGAVEMGRHAAARITGRMTVQGGGVTRTVWFEGGNVVHAESTGPSEELGFHLYQAKAIPPEAFGRLEAERRVSGKSVEALLVEHSLLEPPEIERQAVELAEAIVSEAARLPEPALSLEPGELPPAVPRRDIDLAEILGLVGTSGGGNRGYTADYGDIPAGVFKSLLHDHRNHFIIVDWSVAIEGVDEGEEKLLAYMAEEPRGLEGVRARSTLGRSKTRRFIYALYCEGAITLDPAPGLVLDETYDIDRLEDELERQTETGHFARLGLHFSATGEEVEAAYGRLSAHFDTVRVAGASAEVIDRLLKIRQCLDEAYGELAHDQGRREYRERRATSERLAFHAEVEFRRGGRKLAQGDEPEVAMQCLARAYDLNTREPRYLAYLGLSQAAAHAGDAVRSAKARTRVDRALALAPDDATVVAVAAAYHRVHGDKSLADLHAGKARKLAEGSPESAPYLLALGV